MGFLNLPAEQVDKEIEATLGRVCDCIGADLAEVLTWKDPERSSFDRHPRVEGQPRPAYFRDSDLSV